MSKTLCSALFLAVLGLSVTSFGGTYNYGGDLSLNDGNWTLEKSGLYWDAIFYLSVDEHQLQFYQILGYGEDIANRGAYVWNAPEGQAITKVQYYWWRSGDQTDYQCALFTKGIGESIETANIQWSTNGGGVMYTDGSQTVDIPLAQNVKSIGLGFADIWSSPNCSVLFNTITIITEAAPMHTVSGSVNAGGYTGDLSDIGVKVEFSQNGSVVKTAQVFANASGVYSVPDVIEGTYDITVKGGFWFKKTMTNVVVNGDVTIDGITLVQGDLNADGMVDVGDLGILAANYGSGVSGSVDFNADYAKVFGTAATDTTSTVSENTEDSSDACGNLGLSMIAGLALMGLMLVKVKE
jgi:hypothetical protein